jgi:hypothetical protein
MSVELDPPELAFKRLCQPCLASGEPCILTLTGPFNREVSQVLRLHNPHNDPVGFKVCLQSFRRNSNRWLTLNTGQNHRTEAVRHL